MKKLRWLLFATAAALVSSALPIAADNTTLTGRVLDTAGKPIGHATVMVYHAGVKKGYSTFCPSCYADCGKRAITDGTGAFTFERLSPDLWFELVVAIDGYEPEFVKKVDPSSGAPVIATLIPLGGAPDPSLVFRGRVEDLNGAALPFAVVQPKGVLLDATGSSTYGTIPGLDALAISNERGEFDVHFAKLPAGNSIFGGQPGTSPKKILVSVEARGMAPVFSVIPAGLERHAVSATEGATVRGRLVQDGKPVADAEVGLIGRPHGGFGPNLNLVGNPFEELRIGTQPDGTFAITNVPSALNWYIYGKMESIAARGATGVIECATKRDGEILDVGDIQVKPAYRLRGRVILSDGKPLADGMRVTISSNRAWDFQTAILPPDGRFEFIGLAAGPYSLFASVKGYSSPTPTTPVSIERQVDDFVMTLHPENEAGRSNE